MTGTTEVLVANAAAVLVLLVATWVVSLAIRNASIVDIVWGIGFVLVAWTTFLLADGSRTRKLTLAVLVTVWGLRLAVHLAWRNIGKGEDFRYRAMRKKHDHRFPLKSLYTVFLTQALLMWVVSLPVQLAMVPALPRHLGVLAIAGLALWVVGLFFETVGDLQLARFKADPATSGTVMDKGLWRYTRHPNYFGDFAVWWGIFLVAAETGTGRFGVIGPIVMSVLLMKVSGVGMLERTIGKRRRGYDDYVTRTSTFFPRPPKGGPANSTQ